MWIYLSRLMAHRKRIEAVEHMTSNEIQIWQYLSPKGQKPKISLTRAKVITKHATKRSAIASDTTNRFPILRKLLSLQTATQTSILPKMDRKMTSDIKIPAKEGNWNRWNLSVNWCYLLVLLILFLRGKWEGMGDFWSKGVEKAVEKDVKNVKMMQRKMLER